MRVEVTTMVMLVILVSDNATTVLLNIMVNFSYGPNTFSNVYPCSVSRYMKGSNMCSVAYFSSLPCKIINMSV